MLRLIRRLSVIVPLIGAVCAALVDSAELKRQPYVNENFDAKSWFYEGSSSGVEYSYTKRGAYKIDAMSSKGVGSSIVQDKIGDFELSVDVRLLDYDEEAMGAAAGVLFRVVVGSAGSNSYYTFNFDNVGKFHSGKLTDDKFTRFYPGQDSTALNTGWNTLKVRAIGKQIILYINDEQVSLIEDATIPAGGYGLYCTPGTAAEFDNFKIDLLLNDEPQVHQGTVELPDLKYTTLAKDDFSGGNPLFYDGEDEYSSFKYTDHKSYRVDLTNSPWPTPSTIAGEMSDGRVGVDCFFTNAPTPQNDHIGLVVRYRDRPDLWGDYYVLEVYASGYYKFVRVMGEEIIDIKRATLTDAIRKGGVNRLQVICEGTKFYIVINDIPLVVVEDATIEKGGYGIYVSAGVTAEFQSFIAEAVKGTIDTTGMVKPMPDNAIDLGLKVNNYFSCNFDDAEAIKFAVGEKLGFTLQKLNGEYVVDAMKADDDAYSFVSGRFNRYKASVKAKRLDGADRLGFGIVVQVTPSQTSHIAFVITNDGYYSVLKATKGTVEKLVDWTKSDLIKLDDYNTIEVSRQGDTFTLRIGGEIVEMLPIEGIGAGGLALVTAKGVKAAFDDFVINSPD